MAEWRPEGYCNPWRGDHFVDLAQKQRIEAYHDVFEIAADEVIRGIWHMAQESPTGTFTFDARRGCIFAGNGDAYLFQNAD